MRFIYCLALALLNSLSWGQTFEKNFILASTTKGLEYGNAGLELPNGNYLIGINNSVLCLSANGDSLWKKTYTNYGDIQKIFTNNQGKVILATTFGKMLMVEINEANGDTLSTFRPPNQIPNSGYAIFDVKVLPDGDYILLYNNGGGNGSIITRFTPKATTRKWTNDYAGQNFGPKTILVDDTCLVIAGYKGNVATNWMFDIHVSKFSINNTPIFNRTFVRYNSTYRDRLMGVQKNSKGNYLIACNWIVNNRGCPAVFSVSATGDSLGISTYVAHGTDSLNQGYAYSLERNGNNGFVAAGLININKLNPLNNQMGVGYLCALKVSDDGQITQASLYNNSPFVEFNAGTYGGTTAWGNGGFMTQDGHYLIYGVGNIILPGASANTFNTYFKSYVVKGKWNSTGINNPISTTMDFKIYPNPASDKMWIESNVSIKQVRLYNLQGTIVYEGTPEQVATGIDLRHLPEALYLLNLEDVHGKQHTKYFLKSIQ